MNYQNENGYPSDDGMYTEGIIDDTLKAAAGVDPKEVKDAWNNATSNYDKIE